MKYLTRVEEVYRVANEAEAEALLAEAKKDKRYVLTKYSSVKKEKKEKGEVVEEWVRVMLVKDFTEEKDPQCQVDVDYKTYDVFSLKEED